MVWFCLLINLHPLSWSLFVTLISLDCCFLQPLCISLKFTVLNVFLSSMTEDGESGKDLQCEFCGEHKWTWRGWSTYEECKIFLFLNTNLNWWILCSMIGLGCSFPELIWMYWLQLLTVILLDFFFSGYFAIPITQSSLVYHSLCNQFSELGTFASQTNVFIAISWILMWCMDKQWF